MQAIRLQNMYLNNITNLSLHVYLANTPSSMIFKCSKLSTWFPQMPKYFYFLIFQVTQASAGCFSLSFSILFLCFSVTWFGSMASSMGLYTHTHTCRHIQAVFLKMRLNNVGHESCMWNNYSNLGEKRDIKN